jgi:hypothetical protein
MCVISYACTYLAERLYADSDVVITIMLIWWHACESELWLRQSRLMPAAFFPPARFLQAGCACIGILWLGYPVCSVTPCADVDTSPVFLHLLLHAGCADHASADADGIHGRHELWTCNVRCDTLC